MVGFKVAAGSGEAGGAPAIRDGTASAGPVSCVASIAGWLVAAASALPAPGRPPASAAASCRAKVSQPPAPSSNRAAATPIHQPRPAARAGPAAAAGLDAETGAGGMGRRSGFGMPPASMRALASSSSFWTLPCRLRCSGDAPFSTWKWPARAAKRATKASKPARFSNTALTTSPPCR